MYVNEAVELACNYAPNEYNIKNFYIWIDEVNAMLTMEDKEIYCVIKLPIANDRSILIPQPLNIEHIVSVECDGKAYDKNDICVRDRYTWLIPGRGRIATVTYQKQYEPIRQTKYKGDVIISGNSFDLPYNTDLFQIGDSVIFITQDGDKYELHIMDMEPTEKNRSMYNTYTFQQVSAHIPTDNTYQGATIARIITDRTVCEAPFDTMYVDYLIAKINLYQHDNDAYSQYMASFNSRLDTYKRWLNSRMPLPPTSDGKFKNLW